MNNYSMYKKTVMPLPMLPVDANNCSKVNLDPLEPRFCVQNWDLQGHTLFSSPEPKAHGELIVYRSIRCPSVRASVNIFKLEYLRNQWANCNQILSEASLGWGIDCIRFWTR